MNLIWPFILPASLCSSQVQTTEALNNSTRKLNYKSNLFITCFDALWNGNYNRHYFRKFCTGAVRTNVSNFPLYTWIDSARSQTSPSEQNPFFSSSYLLGAIASCGFIEQPGVWE